MSTTPPASLVAAQLEAAWTRWQQRPAPRSNSSISDDEAQFDLVALGLAATLSSSQLRELFAGDGEDGGALALLLPLQPAFQQDPRRFHFALVVVAKLVERALEESSKQEQQFQWKRIVDALLLPLLQRQQFARVHSAVLATLRLFVNAHGAAIAATLADTVAALLVDEATSPQEQDEDDTDSTDDAHGISFSALCGVLKLLLECGDGQHATAAVLDRAQQVCARAISRFDTAPHFLRAVSTQLIPALLRVAPDSARELTAVAIDAWRTREVELKQSKSVSNVMFLLCLLLPGDPSLMADNGLQEITAFALANADALLRKQGMYLLNIAFSHYALEASASRLPAELETWQRFIVASDVIQMHEQLHLIEQVWPHVTRLLESSLVVLRGSTDPSSSPVTSSSLSSWPVKMSFDWIQSLLLRVFGHENPLVRRTFMMAFMETCLKQWRAPTQSAAIDAEASFVCSASFHVFVFEHLLPAFNDPQMYKTSTKEAFQKVTREFLAAYLSFQLANSAIRRNQLAGLPAATNLIKSYVDAVYDSIFGPGVSGHSPDALVTMLEAFSDTELQTVMQQREIVSTADLLDEEALDKLRITMEFRVLRSFPQSIRVKITRALVSALTGGFTDISAHSLQSIASILLVLPLRIVIGDDGSTYVAIHRWLHSEHHRNTNSRIGVFVASLSSELARYLSKHSHELGARVLSANQLSRLLLFVSDISHSSEHAKKSVVKIHTPLARLVGGSDFDSSKLLRLIGKFEEEVAQVAELAVRAQTYFAFAFNPQTFYGTEEGSSFSYKALFQAGQNVTTLWTSNLSTGLDSDASADDGAQLAIKSKEDDIEVLAATALVVTRTAIYMMEQDGDLAAVNALDGICESLKSVISPEMAPRVDASEQTLAIRYLSVVASQSTAVDSLQALQGDTMLPLLLAARLNASAENSGNKHYALCNVQYFVSRWTLMHNVLLGSSYLSTELLHHVFTACLDALSAVGADPHVLHEMVQVLSLALAQLAATFVKADDRDERLDALYHAVWGEYSECLAKPDVLTRAVVHCLFQPAFLLSEELCSGTHAPMKRWFHRFLSFGEVHRPNVIFHLTCRLVQVWSAHPHSALWFVDEIVTLLIFKEPIIDEKEQLALAPGTADAKANPAPGALFAKNKLVRLVVLSFLDEISVDSAAPDSQEHTLLQQLIVRLLGLNMTEEWTKQHMLNSDGFGKKIRCWQALCVLSKHVNGEMLEAVNDLLWRAFVFPHLPAMRYYMEIFAMRLLLRFPSVTIRKYMVPLLGNYNLIPQVGASLLLVAGYALYNRLDAQLESDSELCALLVRAILPWLNSSHGHTRILVQFMLAVVLPRYLHQYEQQQQVATPTSSSTATTFSPTDLQFLKQTATFLSQNKEAKRMNRRQLNQLTKFRPEFECSLIGVLSSASLNEFSELFPSEDVLVFGAQFKDAMTELYAQFQRENFVPDTPSRAVLAAQQSSAAASQEVTTLNVQRKIDLSAILLDESVLPVAMRERGEMVAALNVRNKRRQPVILCASLVDKIPNLAGLARTCEIFNAQTLVVPNAHACEDEMFATISVTANKWMPIEQVRPDQGELVPALQEWKRQGYTIVALEQTASSVCLSSYEFPEKIVIVLGKEKEGVPVDVLQMVDVCVEIPQFGLIRSLNVHVSGAILLWEYTQQRMVRGETAV